MNEISKELKEELDRIREIPDTDISTNDRAGMIIRAMQEDALRRMSMFMRVRFILGSIVRNDKNLEDSDINWDKINEVLHYPTSDKDYNIIPEKVSSVQQLIDINDGINMASIDLGSWQVHKCKDCGGVFYLTYGEVMFYKNHDLAIPKRCSDCRHSRRQSSSEAKRALGKDNKPRVEPPQPRKDYSETAMEAAFRKAGYKGSEK